MAIRSKKRTTATREAKSQLTQRLVSGSLCLIGLLVCGELLARALCGLGHPPLFVRHPEIEYFYRPNQATIRFGNKININRYGMRSEDFERTDTDAIDFRVMVFGDSIVNGGARTDQAELATSILKQKLLETDKYGRVLVGNISAGSWGPPNQLAYAKNYGFFEADVLVLVISSHDYADVPTFRPLNQLTHPTKLPTLAISEAFNKISPKIWRIFAPVTPNTDEVSPQESDISHALSCLRELLSLMKSASPKVLVVQFLSQKEVAENKFEPGYEHIKAICDELAIPRISTAEKFGLALNGNRNPFQDAIHPNEIGHELLAGLINEWISENAETDADQAGASDLD